MSGGGQITATFSSLAGSPYDNANLSSALNSKLPTTTKYGADLSYSGNELRLKDQDGNNLGNAVVIESSPAIDNKSITKNASQQLQTIGVIDQGNTSVAIKEHKCTRAEYNAMASHDSNTKYIITDDTDLSLPILQALYPVGSCFMTFNATCPLSNLFGTWQNVGTKLLIDVTGSDSVPIMGNGMTLGLTSGAKNVGLTRGSSSTYTSLRTDAYGVNVSSSSYGAENNTGRFGVTNDATKSGIIADISNSLTKSELTINIFQRTA